jgi:hypothetical protein
MARVQETAASIVVSPILIAMPQNSDQFIFFLDTPRAAGGLNHRYFVASPANNDESKITHYATLARENLIGSDYIAASRPAAQVSRGQEREGLELLVLAGISTADATRTAHLLRVLGTMLNSMPDSPVPVEQSSHGLLLPSQRMADMEHKLRAELNQDISASPGRPESNAEATQPAKVAKGRRHFPLRIIFVCGTLLVVALGVWKLPYRRTEEPFTGKPVPSDGHRISVPIEKQHREDWKFLEDDPIWKNLGSLTGLSDNWDVAAANTWASQILMESDPSVIITNGPTNSADVRDNLNVRLLLNSVENVIKSGTPIDSASVSKEWLRLSGSNATKLNNLLRDLTPGDAESKNIGTLKTCLLEWSRAVITFVDDKSGAPQPLQAGAIHSVNSLRKLVSDQSKAIPILMNADLQRLEFVTEFLNSDEFAKAVEVSAYGKDWQSREWQERLNQLHDMSTDGKLAPAVKRLIERLAAASAPLRIN